MSECRSKQVMTAILNNELRLNVLGFSYFSTSSDDFEMYRKDMLSMHSLNEFEKARSWLAKQPKIKKLNYRCSSYGLKHAAERSIGYVSNGVFIAAAIAEGFQVKRRRNSFNALLNISSSAWRGLPYRRRPE